MKLPDKRYTATLEHCGHESPMWIARFCGDWLKDSELWPDRAACQAPPYETKQQAIAACVGYQQARERLLRGHTRQQADLEIYPD